MSGRKIAAATVQNRTQTPLWNWVRNKLLAVDRQKVTPPPGIAGEDGKAVYQNPLRFPKTQSARPCSQILPELPGGVHHLESANYYYTRDGRREVVPPEPLYSAKNTSVRYSTQTGQDLKKEEAIQVNFGPESNFGLQAPTPGFGATWTRSREQELQTQKEDASFAHLERFDKFSASK
ncbi:unnamed protein product [Auanema sp. JU1783]|nr:unnamed protein product [Auanema sp. JU1783]